MRAAGSVPSAGREAEPDQGDLPIRALLVSSIARAVAIRASRSTSYSSSVSVSIVAKKIRSRSRTITSGMARRFWHQAGWWSAPPKNPTTTIKSPLGR